MRHKDPEPFPGRLTRLGVPVAQTQFEAWLAMQQTAEGSLKSCSVESSVERCTVVPIYNADNTLLRDVLPDALRKMWAVKTPDDAFEILKQEDVTVTNQSDKEMQLPKILALADEVREVLGRRNQDPMNDEVRPIDGALNEASLALEEP